jgi:hypothetical protein
MTKLHEDTVSADRKERIIFDPEAWRKSDKSGKKTSAITSRQNFDNEKFTRNDKVDEGTIQPSGDSKVDSAGPTQSDTISQDKQVKKSNNPQIEFVTGTAIPNGSSSTSIGGAKAMGRKLAEDLVKKALKKVKCNEQQYAGLEAEDKPGKKATEFKGSKNAIAGKTVEGWKDEKAPVKEETGCKSDKKTKPKLKQEETTMSKTYNQFMEELDELVEFVPEAIEEGVKIKTATGYIHKGTRGYGNDNSEFDQSDDFDSDDKPKAKPAEPAVKRGRGRPSGSYGTYKARSAETKAAAAAKSAASKAANKAKK